jgi:hypothetical protein
MMDRKEGSMIRKKGRKEDKDGRQERGVREGGREHELRFCEYSLDTKPSQ